MSNKQIIFTKPNTAEFSDVPLMELGPNMIKVRTMFSTVSCGTEKANITGDPNVSIIGKSEVVFPRVSGYSSAGIVEQTGENVKSVKPGDRVVVCWGTHSKYNVVKESNVVKIDNDNISFEEAAVSLIATFSLAALRKARLEIGESVLVMGLGLLGQLAVKLARAAGAVPIIAVDPVAARRKDALKNGADFAFNPFEEAFSEKVKSVTNGGVKVCIEVTGVGSGLDSALDCMAKFGRVSLLGCTRNSDFTIDYYKKVHGPGISLIGAHTQARPTVESHPGWFTHQDDIKAVLNLCSSGRLDIKSMVKETHLPENCREVYTRLVNDKDFPILVQFDWRNVL